MQDYLSSLIKNKPSYGGLFSPKPVPSPSAKTAAPKPPQMSPAPQSMPKPSNPAATSPAPVKPSPARDAYVSSLKSPAPDPLASATSTVQAPPSVNPNAPSNALGGAPVGSLPTPQADPYREAYSSYLESLRPSSEEEQASKNLSALSLQAEKDQEEALSRGETLGFASGEASRVNRNNSFATRAAADLLSALTGKRTASQQAAKARLDFEKDMRSGESAAAKAKFDQDLALRKLEQDDRKFEEDKRQFGMEYVLKAREASQRAASSGSDTTATVDQKSQQRNEALALARELLDPSSPGKRSAVGASLGKIVDIFLPGKATEYGFQGNRAAFENKVATLKSNLTLDNLKLLKGAMSDKDLLFLNSIGSSLSTDMSEKEFDKELTKIITKLENAGAVSPGSGSPQAFMLPDGTTVTLQPDGTYM